jgi:hypothetical protein
LKLSSPLSKLGYTIFFQVKTTTHLIRLTPVKLFIGCFFFFVQLNNYISNLSLLKYFIQKIYGKRDISQQVVTLSKFGNARMNPGRFAPGRFIQGSRWASLMSPFAIFNFIWRQNTALGDFFGDNILFIKNYFVLLSINGAGKKHLLLECASR